MKIQVLLSSILLFALLSSCDDGEKKKTDKCQDVICGDNAHCNTDTGACICNDGFTGDPITGCTASTLCENVTCGDNAHCNPNTGTCICDDGFVGDPITGCTASTLCENVTCGENAHCDLNTGNCVCDAGYIGNPNLSCTPEGHCEANSCSGHGTCDDSSGTVVCTCDTGYTGTYCNTCDTANGYSPDPQNPNTCIVNPCVPDPCYGHGTCTVENGLPVCNCYEGYTGGNCNRCDSANGYEIDTQNPNTCILNVCFGYDCGHGNCLVENGQPTCTCNTGYIGTHCDTCDTDNGYVPSNVTSGTCILNPCRNQTCSGHGTCSLNLLDESQCTCETGYTGTTCNECDTDNNYIEYPIGSGTCVDSSFVIPGDLVITEIMILSTTTPPEDGQWFEITNMAPTPKRLAGLTLWADAASAEIPSDSDLILNPGESFIVGTNPNLGQNGGIIPNQLMAGMSLDSAGGTIEIERTTSGETIDIVTWDNTWNHQTGRTLALSPAATPSLAATLNDVRLHWCFGFDTYGTGAMYGTPGAVNSDCRVVWCGLQYPQTTNTTTRTSTETIYGQVYDALLTVDQDFSPFITAQVGYGPVGAPPQTWSSAAWFNASYNPSFTNQNNEEFMGTLVPTSAGTFDYLYRVSIDGGLSYQYCYWHADGTSPGTLVVTNNSLFFSEYVEGSNNNKALEVYSPFSVDYDLSLCSIHTYLNGQTTSASYNLSGTITAHTTHVICNNSSGTELQTYCNTLTNAQALSFNGNDAIALVCEGTIVDVIGQIGHDPGTEWGDGFDKYSR